MPSAGSGVEPRQRCGWHGLALSECDDRAEEEKAEARQIGHEDDRSVGERRDDPRGYGTSKEDGHNHQQGSETRPGAREGGADDRDHAGYDGHQGTNDDRIGTAHDERRGATDEG